jgi:hypothetical protein
MLQIRQKETGNARKRRYSTEQIITKLREADVAQGFGMFLTGSLSDAISFSLLFIIMGLFNLLARPFINTIKQGNK